jgi:hypothetical protein
MLNFSIYFSPLSLIKTNFYSQETKVQPDKLLQKLKLKLLKY